MVAKGIQNNVLCKIHSVMGDKKNSGVATEVKLNQIHGSKYRIRHDHDILTEHCIFYPQTLYFLKYKLTFIELEYEMLHSEILAEEAHSMYISVSSPMTRDSITRLDIKVNTQMSSLNGLLFVEKFASGAKDSEKYMFPDLAKVRVMINSSPKMVYNNGMESKKMLGEAHHLFVKDKNKSEHMNITAFIQARLKVQQS